MNQTLTIKHHRVFVERINHVELRVVFNDAIDDPDADLATTVTIQGHATLPHLFMWWTNEWWIIKPLLGSGPRFMASAEETITDNYVLRQLRIAKGTFVASR